MRLSKQMKYESAIRDSLSFIACLLLGFSGPSEGVFFPRGSFRQGQNMDLSRSPACKKGQDVPFWLSNVMSASRQAEETGEALSEN